MTKGLKALKEYRAQQQGVNVYADELLDIVEKELKALDIIIDKKVNMSLLYLQDTCQDYNDHIVRMLATTASKTLTQEKYDLLKEVLE